MTFTRVAKSALALALVSALCASGAVAAPNYPPSIQPPAAGEPIQAPVAPKESGAVAVVPVAVSDNIPVVTKTPVAVSAVVKNTNAILPVYMFDSKPVAPAKNVIVGGISAAKKDDLPYATVSGTSKKKVEIQVAEDLPTTLFVEKLAPRATAKVDITVGGKKVTLGSFKVASDGSLELPPLTLAAKGLSITVTVTVGKTIRSFVVRSTN